MMENLVPYNHYHRFVFRSPIMPFTAWNDDFLNCNIFREAVYLSSPEFFEIIKDKHNIEALSPKALNSVLKFYQRMRSRCTPFGLFAGVGTGRINTNSKSLIAVDKKLNSTKTRFDVSFIAKIIERLLEDQDLLKRLNFYVNSSFYKLPPYYRYVEFSTNENTRKYQLSTVEISEYLAGVVSSCNNGAKRQQLEVFLKQFEDDDDSIKEFVSDLIKEQILTSDLEISLTNGDPCLNLVTKLRSYYERPIQVVKVLEELLLQIEKIDLCKIGMRIEKYKTVKEEVDARLFPNNTKHLFQTDLYIGRSFSHIGDSVMACIWQGLHVFNKLSSLTFDRHLDAFRKKFAAKYELEEVPLIEVLDTDLGIGFGDSNSYITDTSPLIKGLKNATKSQQGETNGKASIKDVDLFLYEKYVNAVSNKAPTIYLTDDELEKFENDWNNFPESLSVIFSIINTGGANHEPTILFKTVAGMSGANLINRFGHLDEEIGTLVKEIIQKEETLHEKDFVLAEVIHLPETRMGNVLITSNTREYEIPYLARSLKPVEKQIQISDLLVSVRGDRILLKSKSLGKYIIPRITNAYNYTFGSLAIFEFLGRMQYQSVSGGYTFSWGSLVKNKPFTPRLVYKSCILAPAIWSLTREETSWLLEKENTIEQKKIFFLKNNNFPEKILLKSSDTDDIKLFIDFKIPTLKELFFNEIAGKAVKIEEFIFDDSPQNLIIDKDRQYYTNEIILPVFKRIVN